MWIWHPHEALKGFSDTHYNWIIIYSLLEKLAVANCCKFKAKNWWHFRTLKFNFNSLSHSMSDLHVTEKFPKHKSTTLQCGPIRFIVQLDNIETFFSEFKMPNWGGKWIKPHWLSKRGDMWKLRWDEIPHGENFPHNKKNFLWWRGYAALPLVTRSMPASTTFKYKKRGIDRINNNRIKFKILIQSRISEGGFMWGKPTKL